MINRKYLRKESKPIDLAQDLHKVFLESMEARYKEILSFLGFVIPSITGFVVLIHQYEVADESVRPITTFFFGSASIISILFWGAIYALANSYRYRYLQASVFKIEEFCDAAKYIPSTFKVKAIKGIAPRICISIAPGILQIHVFVFIIAIMLVCCSFIFITPTSNYSLYLSAIGTAAVFLIFLYGGVVYPNKLNRIVEDLVRD